MEFIGTSFDYSKRVRLPSLQLTPSSSEFSFVLSHRSYKDQTSLHQPEIMEESVDWFRKPLPVDKELIHRSLNFINTKSCKIGGTTIHRSMWLFMTPAICDKNDESKIQMLFQHVNWNSLNGSVAYEIANNISYDPMLSNDSHHQRDLGQGLELVAYKNVKVITYL